MFRPRALISVLFLFVSLWLAHGQAVIIEDIDVRGNDKTRVCTIERELTVKIGDQLPFVGLVEQIKQSEINLINTRLFNSARINIIEKENKRVQLVVEVEEIWYIYPVVIFELADRNFNVWWKEQDRSFDRINIGLRLDYLNFTGHKDKLKLKAQYGYTRKYEIQYDFPFLNSTGTWGLSSGILYSSNREVGYQTLGNKLQFYNSDDFVYNRFRISSTAYYRPGHRRYHSFKFEFYNNNIDDEIVARYNENFFNGQREMLRYFVLEYDFDYNGLDHFAYPIKGSYMNFKIRKEGLGLYDDVNLLNIESKYSIFRPITARWSHAHSIKGRVQLIRDLPGYYHYTALGYNGDQLRGYEFYVVDGLDYLYSKNHIKYLFWETSWALGDWMFIQQFRKPTIKAFAALAFDMGYVNSPYFKEGNQLVNETLYGGGPAIHVLIFNHFLFKAEYSINSLGEKNLFLHFNASF